MINNIIIVILILSLLSFLTIISLTNYIFAQYTGGAQSAPGTLEEQLKLAQEKLNQLGLGSFIDSDSQSLDKQAKSVQEKINQSDPHANFTTIQWQSVLIEAIGMNLEYPSDWEGSTFSHGYFRAHPKYELYKDSNIFRTEFELHEYGKPPFNNLEVLTRMEAVSALEFSFADNAEFQLTEAPSINKYNIDGEKAGSFSYKQFYSSATYNIELNIEEIVLIHNGKFFNLKFEYREGAFDEEYITKIKDHMFNSIRWLNSTQLDRK